jgi:hypothetical protein
MQWQRPLAWPSQPHGQGFIAATNWNRAGNHALARGAQDVDHARLDQLAQHFARGGPIRQFVAEKDTLVRFGLAAYPATAGAAPEASTLLKSYFPPACTSR